MSKKREHLLSLTKKDFVFQAFRAGGKGGQHQNKNDTAMRCIHPESGAVGECREHKSQHRNKQTAFQRMTKHVKFKMWINQKSFEAMGEKSIEDRVEAAMADENLRVEVKENGKWVTVDPKDIMDE